MSLLSRLPAPPAGAASGPLNGAEKPGKDAASRGFRELKEALKILESLKNMTVEQLWTGGSPTSPTSTEPASTSSQAAAASVSPATSEKPTKEKRFLDDIKKLQENLRKTLDNVAIVEEEKMEAVVEAAGGSAGAAAEVSVFPVKSPSVNGGKRVLLANLVLCGSLQAERGGEEKGQQEALTPVGSQDQWPSEILSETPVLCQQSGGKPGVTFTSAKGEVFSVLEWAPGEEGRGHMVPPPVCLFLCYYHINLYICSSISVYLPFRLCIHVFVCHTSLTTL